MLRHLISMDPVSRKSDGLSVPSKTWSLIGLIEAFVRITI